MFIMISHYSGFTLYFIIFEIHFLKAPDLVKRIKKKHTWLLIFIETIQEIFTDSFL